MVFSFFFEGRQNTREDDAIYKISRMKVIKESVLVSLMSTPEWSPYRLDTAEAIIGVTLGYPEAFEEHKSEYFGKLANMNIDLLAALKNDSELSNNVWSRGKLAQYISAIVVACPHEAATAYYGTDNLLDILQKQLQSSVDYFRINRFALSWMALAMCQHNRTFDSLYEDILTAHPGTYTFGTDEASMITMACVCLKTETCSSAAQVAADLVSQEIQKENNTLNVYSLGLAAQALISTKNASYANQISKAKMGIMLKLDVKETMKYGLAASHILPALADMSYLDIEIHPPVPGKLNPSTEMMMLSITITMKDYILTNITKQWNAHVSVPTKPTLLQVMTALQDQPSSTFSFGTAQTSFGPSVVTIDGITRNETNMYWRSMTAPDTPLQQGVAKTYPVDGDHYIFELTYFGPH
ncbi:transcobalamin-2-like [Mizuhopecten yessoensis]|uniref:transcobalamin-2-like n=1 Tax=Mizuhopecten yessoensis TaxID=6573 RepID=UPI000B458987|nr:transcobalamin-2-like [Mizuhopecten yessoensis]